jgi:hypothetical protein
MNAQTLNIQATLIAAFKQIKETTGANLDTIIEQITSNATDSAMNLITSQAQIAKVHSLADRFRVKVPMPQILPEPPGFVRD